MKENTVTRAITLLQWKLKFYTTQVTKVIQVILWPSDNMNAHFPIGMLSSCTKPDWLLSALMSNPESRRHTSWTSSAAVLRLWEITDPLPHSQALQGPPSAFFIKVPAQCHKRASLFFFFELHECFRGPLGVCGPQFENRHPSIYNIKLDKPHQQWYKSLCAVQAIRNTYKNIITVLKNNN